jgi:hypothetical protein
VEEEVVDGVGEAEEREPGEGGRETGAERLILGEKVVIFLKEDMMSGDDVDGNMAR